MLIDVTTDERMDRVSTCGYAFGYIGSCIPFVAGLLLILNCDTIGLPMVTATRISFVITMVWWIIMSIPLYKNVHQQYSLPHEPHVCLLYTSKQDADKRAQDGEQNHAGGTAEV